MTLKAQLTEDMKTAMTLVGSGALFENAARDGRSSAQGCAYQ